jgi:predicted PurR-regulated permease PerM
MKNIHASCKVSYAHFNKSPQPVTRVSRMWVVAGRAATIGVFFLLFGAFLYVARPILMPVFGATVIATTLAPLIKHAMLFRVPPWITALLIVTIIALGLGAAATMMAGPVSEWIARAPEIESTVRNALSVLAKPLAALRSLEDAFAGTNSGTLKVGPSPSNVILPVLAFVTPAAAQLLLFFGTLIFILAGQIELRRNIAMLFTTRDARLRFLKIINNIEQDLARYLTIVTIVNIVLGIVVALGAWNLGLPNPAIFGILASILNYVPYVGPAVMAFILFGVGLVTFSSLSHASVAPLCLIGLTTLEGHFITPTIIGRHLTLNPLVVFLGLAFWSWLWGPIGAFFAVPLSIGGLVIYNHLFAENHEIPLD